jgi:hypothetical protein
MSTESPFLYIFKNEITKMCKVGISGTPLFRKAVLQNASGCDLSIRWVIRIDDAKKQEDRLLKHFSKYRKQGEWLAIPEELLDMYLENIVVREAAEVVHQPKNSIKRLEIVAVGLEQLFGKFQGVVTSGNTP